MKKDQDQADNHDEVESSDEDQTAENESSDAEYERDESNRGERPGHLRQRSDWFQKRTGGR
jgi:hypothetical protein